MATAVKDIDPRTLEILRSLSFDGNLATLTCGQLPRPEYDAVNKVLTGLGGKWNRSKKGHLFDDDARDVLEAVIETGRYTNAKQLFGFFETPRLLADELAELAEISPGMRLLEPSAGKGALVVAARKRGADPIHAVELNRKYAPDIRQAGARFVVVGDFLRMTTPPPSELLFERVLMNPPFARQADIDHVLHAWKFLADGGCLVSVMSSSSTFRTNSKSLAFLAFVDQFGKWRRNDPNAFKASGTGAQTVTVVLYKTAPK